MVDYRVTMEKEKFLASGLLEQYALGLTSAEEANLVEHFVENYPDIRKKLQALQEAVEKYASEYAVPPPRRLKKRILSEILADELPETDMEREPPILQQSSVVSQLRFSKSKYLGLVGAIFISIVLILILLWRQQQLKASNRALLGELHTYQTQYTNLKKEETLAEKIFNYIENGNADVIHLRGTHIAKDAHAVVYWNEGEQKAHVKLVKMPAIPAGKQFQVWAQVNGRMINAGLLDNAGSGLQPIKYIMDTDSLDITVEPLGGSAYPSVRLLVANGEI